MKQKLAIWISQQHQLPYRVRKSAVKRIAPAILNNHAFDIDFYGMRYLGNTSDSTDRLFFMFGGCEKYMLSLMRDVVQAIGNKNATMLDIGAHVGNHALFMSHYVKTVHAFEPNPRLQARINKHMANNNLQNIRLHSFGLADYNADIPFYVAQKDHTSTGSFCPDHDARNNTQETLSVKHGDEVVASENISDVEIIKIDVEGFEKEVLAGLKKTLQASQPMVILELSETTRRKIKDASTFASLFPADYVFLQFSGVSRERDSYKLAPFAFEKHIGHLDVIALPREKMRHIQHKITKILKRNKCIGGTKLRIM